MRALIDTCILSELRNPKSIGLIQKILQPFAAKDLFISVVSIGEITKGISLLTSSKKKSELQAWTMQLENNYSDRILNINCEVAHIWGELTAKAQKHGKIIPIADELIAATALANGLHIITRNSSHFEPAGVFVINPWN